MKFTEQEAFDELKKQLKSIVGDPAINDRGIREQIATLLPLIANDETELTEFCTKMLPVLKNADGASRKFASNSVKKREEELKAAKQGGEGNATEPSKPDDITKLMERIEKLEKEKAENDRKAAIGAKRKELAESLKGKGVNDDGWVNDFLSEVTIAEDVDIEATAEKYLKLYNRSHANAPVNVTPKGSGGADMEDDTFADIVKMRKAADESRGELKTN